MPYHHTQRAILIVAVCLASAAFAAATVWQSGQWPAAIVPIALIAAALVFSSLTVEVNGKELRWYFGLAACRTWVRFTRVRSILRTFSGKVFLKASR
jgi:hypothetical protein